MQVPDHLVCHPLPPHAAPPQAETTVKVTPVSAMLLGCFLPPPLNVNQRHRLLCAVPCYTEHTSDEPVLSYDLFPLRYLQLLGWSAKMTMLCINNVHCMHGFNFWLAENGRRESRREHSWDGPGASAVAPLCLSPRRLLICKPVFKSHLG